MKAILFFHPVNDFTGSTRALYNTIEQEYKNIPLTIIVEQDKKGFLSSLPNAKIISIYYPLYKGKGIRLISNLIRRIHIIFLLIFVGLFHKEFYINTILPFYGAIGAFLLHKKCTYHIHEFFINKTPIIKKAEFIFNRVRSNRIFVSSYLKKCYKENLDCPYEIKYNKLSESFLKNVKITPVANRKRNTILMLASLSKSKGVMTFIYTSELLPEYNFQLIISSDINSIYNFIKEEGYENKLPSNLNIYPAQSNVHPFFENADLILNLTNPSFSIETFGLTILEAMPYGIPAIVPNVGGPIELVTHEYNGLCVDVSDKYIVKKSINNILSDKKIYEVMAINTLQTYKEKFSV